MVNQERLELNLGEALAKDLKTASSPELHLIFKTTNDARIKDACWDILVDRALNRWDLYARHKFLEANGFYGYF